MKSALRLCAASLTVLVPIERIFAQMPVIEPAGVKNAASYAPVIAPQMLVSVFSHDFSNLTFTSKANPFPTQLNGTTVTFNGIAAPILYLSVANYKIGLNSGIF